jgi:flavin prenyltransferase
VYGKEDWMAPAASGSGAPSAMVVVPCSTGTLSAIACGACNNLIERAADVVLKERRQLILVPREAPFSSIHLENMLKLSSMGATILPAAPGFYHQPQTIDDLIDFRRCAHPQLFGCAAGHAAALGRAPYRQRRLSTAAPAFAQPMRKRR